MQPHGSDPLRPSTVTDDGSGGGAAGAPLDNYANNSSPDLPETARKRRYRYRNGLWNISTLVRCRACGRATRTASAEVGVRVSEGRAGFAGLVSCGSVWVCAVCSSKIMARRALEIGASVAVAPSLGLSVGLQTLTVRHHAHQTLARVWDGVGKGWSRATSGKGWKADRERFGHVGYIRVQEVTIGPNGWHPHVHAVHFARDLSPSGMEELHDAMWRRWAAGARAAGLAAPLPHASDIQVVRSADLAGTKLGEYLSKGVADAGKIGMELTQTQSKVARSVHSTVPVWSLLDGAINGEADPLWLWHEWEKASKNRRQIAWSTGLRDLLGLRAAEQTDEEIAAEELGGEADTVVYISREGWDSLVRRPWLIADVLDAAEQTDTETFCRWLTEHGIEHRRV